MEAEERLRAAEQEAEQKRKEAEEAEEEQSVAVEETGEEQEGAVEETAGSAETDGSEQESVITEEEGGSEEQEERGEEDAEEAKAEEETESPEEAAEEEETVAEEEAEEEPAIRTQPWIVEHGDKTVIAAVEAEGEGLGFRWEYYSEAGTEWREIREGIERGIFAEAEGEDSDELTIRYAEAMERVRVRCVIMDQNGNEMITKMLLLD